MTFAYGYDALPRYNLDGLGAVLIALTTIWTLLLSWGVVFLLRNRKLPILRIRNLPLAISAVSTLHIYLCLCLLAYVFNGNFPCDLEYWIMSIYLPLGIALYQASSTQLLDVAQSQRMFATSDLAYVELKKPGHRHSGIRMLLSAWKPTSPTKSTMTYIGIGMTAQFISAIIIFLVSRQFHTGWGIIGQQVSAMECRKGWEWWPSIVWQFAWSWFYAPYVIWKVRFISDVHAWRIQTVICCIAGLPATPMWLTALYTGAFSQFNKYWIPPMWFSVGIVIIEASVVFIPCWQILKNRKLKKETLQIIAEWENKQKKERNDNGYSIGSDSARAARRSTVSCKSSFGTSINSRKCELYTMNALEKALETNPTPLLLFSALKDFSGENISFLTSVREWKSNWDPPQSRGAPLRKPSVKQLEGEALHRAQYTSAVRIYSSFASLRHSRYPVNLSSTHQRELEALFDGAVSLLNGSQTDNEVTPFNDYWSAARPSDIESGSAQDKLSIASTIISQSTDTISSLSGKKMSSEAEILPMEVMQTAFTPFLMIPESFGPKAFDNAEASIKYVVLTNTWPKFVAAGYANTIGPQTTTMQTAKKAMSHWAESWADKWADSFPK